MQIPKHKPPSRIRYEKNHPTISFRLDREEKKRLEKVLEGKSFADFVKEGIGVREREKKSLERVQRFEYGKGYAEGYEKAKNRYIVQAPCAICGEPITEYSDEAKIELRRFIRSQGWCHLRCEEAERRYRRFRKK